MAVSANQVIKARNIRERKSVPVATNVRIYEGTLVYLTASGFATDVIASGANSFAGVAMEEVDNTGGADGAKRVEVAQGEFELPGSGLTQSLVGDKIYGTDNYTVTATSTNNTLLGRGAEFISSTRLFVATEYGAQS